MFIFANVESSLQLKILYNSRNDKDDDLLICGFLFKNMDTISVQGFKIEINHFEPQISKSGRPFRLSGVQIVRTKPAQWVNKMLLHGTIYSFRYLDEQDGFFAFEFDPFNNFISKI